ncbi:hypothetical protein C8Q77DRAFT_429699 [Trametes polyzona]|nr:hypothetical protein C8Q77DRAFT_429699 [Trametes polyzona]
MSSPCLESACGAGAHRRARVHGLAGVLGRNRKPAMTCLRHPAAACHLAISMDLGTLVNPGETGGIRTANTGNPRVTDMATPPRSQIRPNTAKQRAEKPPGPRRHHQRTSSAKQRKQQPDEQRVRGGAKPSTLSSTSPAHVGATSPRHRRHRQPPSPAGDRPLGRTRTPPRQGRSAATPPSSPARDLLRHAQRSAATDTDVTGRRPFVMDLILASRPVVSRYSEDVIMEAIELSRAALRPTAGIPVPSEDAGEDACRSSVLRWDARTVYPGAGGGLMGDGKTPQQLAEGGYQLPVSAERSTAVWAQDDTSPQGLPTPGHIPSPSIGTPQHMQL